MNDPLVELEAALEEMTPGPWSVEDFDGKHYGTTLNLNGEAEITVWGTQGGHTFSREIGHPACPSRREIELRYGDPNEPDAGDVYCDSHWESTRDLANAEGIAALRNHAPALIEEVKRLRARLAAQEERERALVEALGHYANKANWRRGKGVHPESAWVTAMDVDQGEAARKVLAAYTEEGE